jgi:hypothetical protein
MGVPLGNSAASFITYYKRRMISDVDDIPNEYEGPNGPKMN